MIHFLLVRDARTEQPVGLLLAQDRELAWMAKGETAQALEVLAKLDKTYVESRNGPSTVMREVKRGDYDFLQALRFRLVAPLVPMYVGKDEKSRTLHEAGPKLWRLLISDDAPPIVPV